MLSSVSNRLISSQLNILGLYNESKAAVKDDPTAGGAVMGVWQLVEDAAEKAKDSEYQELLRCRDNLARARKGKDTPSELTCARLVVRAKSRYDFALRQYQFVIEFSGFVVALLNRHKAKPIEANDDEDEV